MLIDRVTLNELLAQTEQRAREAARAELNADRDERKRADDIRHEEALERTRADRLRRGGFHLPGDDDEPSGDDDDLRSHRSHHSRRSHRRNRSLHHPSRREPSRRSRRTRQRPTSDPSDSSSSPSRSPTPRPRRSDRHKDRSNRHRDTDHENRRRDTDRKHHNDRSHRRRREHSFDSYDSDDDYIRRRRNEFKPEKIGYFDPYTKTAGVEMETRYGNRTYHSIHLFLQSARDQSRILDPQDVRDGLGQCLQGAAAEWHTHQLSETVKDKIRGGHGIERWETLLLGKFKMSTTKALRLLDQEWFSFDSIRNGRSIAEFVTTVMRLSREAEFREEHVKLSQAWSRLEPSMRDVIPRPTTRTTVDDFIRVCEEHEETWQEKAARYSGRYNNQQTQQQATNPQAGGNRRNAPRYDNRQQQQGRPPALPYRADLPQQQSQPNRPTYATPTQAANEAATRPNQRLLLPPNVSTGDRDTGTAGRGYENRGRGGAYNRGSNNDRGGYRGGQGYQNQGQNNGRQDNRQDNRAPQGGYFAEPEADDRYADVEDEGPCEGYDEEGVGGYYQDHEGLADAEGSAPNHE